MVDTNAPAVWRVVERKTGKVIAEFPHMLRALAKCEELEPYPEVSGFRYTMEPVRSVDVSAATERNDG